MDTLSQTKLVDAASAISCKKNEQVLIIGFRFVGHCEWCQNKNTLAARASAGALGFSKNLR